MIVAGDRVQPRPGSVVYTVREVIGPCRCISYLEALRGATEATGPEHYHVSLQLPGARWAATIGGLVPTGPKAMKSIWSPGVTVEAMEEDAEVGRKETVRE